MALPASAHALPVATHALPEAEALLQLFAHLQGLHASSLLDTARSFLGDIYAGMPSAAVSTGALSEVANAPHLLPASHALVIGSLGESLAEDLYAVSRQADALVQQQLTSAPRLLCLVAPFASFPPELL